MAVTAMAGVLALASASNGVLLACGIALIVLVFTLGATSSSRSHVPYWSGALAALAALGALTWTYLDETADLTPMAALLGVALIVSIIVQLWRRDNHHAPTVTLMTAVTSCVLAMLPVGWLALRATSDGVYSVGFALLGVGTIGLAEIVPVSRAIRRVGGVLVAAVVAAVLVMAVDEVGEPVPAVSAVVVAAFAGVMGAVAFAAADRLADEWAAVSAPVSVGINAQAEAEAKLGAPTAVSAPAAAAQTGSPAGEITARQAALVPLRISFPFIAAAPAAYVLGRIFVG